MPPKTRPALSTTSTPAPTKTPPSVPHSPKPAALSARVKALYANHPAALALRSAFPSSNSMLVDGISVALVDHTDSHDPPAPREWNAFVYALADPINVQPFYSKSMLTWWLRCAEGIAAVHAAFDSGKTA